MKKSKTYRFFNTYQTHIITITKEEKKKPICNSRASSYHRRSSKRFGLPVLLVLLGSAVNVVQAVFTPEDGPWNTGPLKTAINNCLSETADGSCPTFAASNGVMGDWDVSKVTRMTQSKSTLNVL